jgi:Protein of unknown function (DUF3800)
MPDIEAYFDESEDAHAFSLGGYIFRRQDRIAFESSWNATLTQYGVPYFHMKEAGKPTGFLHLSPSDTLDLYKGLIGLIKLHAAGGYAVTFPLALSNLLPKGDFYGITRLTPYSFCSNLCFLMIKHWIDKNRYRDAVGVVFEDGHRSKNEANRILPDYFEKPEVTAKFFPGEYRFSTKREATALQAADILAWHRRKFVSDQIIGRTKLRKDYLALLDADDDKYFSIDLHAENMFSVLRMLARAQNPNGGLIMTYRVGPLVPYSP